MIMKTVRRWYAPMAYAIGCGLVLGASPVWGQERQPGEIPAKASLEEGLWSEFSKAERSAASSADRVKDPALEAYVKQVSCRVAPEFCNELRVYVMNRPVFNAQAAGNGYIEVWSGMMLSAANEAEFAFVLSHEISHYTGRDSLDAFQRMKSTQMAATVAVLAIAVVGVSAASNQTNVTDMQDVLDLTRVVADLTYLGVISTYFGFSREQEAEADINGYRRLVRAGYDPKASTEIWQTVTDLHRSSDFPRKRKHGAVSSIFNTHPVNAERISYLQNLIKADVASGDTNAAAYREKIRPFLRPWLERTLELKDYGYMLALIERLSQQNADLGLLLFMKGEVYRKRNNSGDAALAISAFQAASAHKDAPVELYRELGGVATSAGERDVAKSAFAKYLELAPEAEDAWLIKESMEALG